MSYRVFDGYMSPQSDGYVHVSNAGNPIYFFDGYNLAFLSGSEVILDSSQGVFFFPNREVAPINPPSNGALFYVEDGAPIFMTSNGLVQKLADGRVVSVMPSDADYTAVQADYQNKIIEVTSSVSLTATRQFILPNVSGYQWIVFNNTTGAQSITFVVSGQTGVTVANGKRAIVYCNATDIVRVTPDT
jgi:hypothetical protein